MILMKNGSNLRKTIWKWLMSLMLIVLTWVRHGDVYVECVRGLQLYNSDLSHPSPAGSYRLLAACVFMQFLVSLLAAIIMQVYRLKRLFIYRG